MIIYDVVLSFAGEDREYVEKIAYLLKSRGIKVFYDKFETSTLWGKDLYQYFNDVYKNKAKYCVIFVSANYIEKIWPLLELKSAQAKDFECKNEYILPVYLENAVVPGLNKTIGHVSANEYSCEEIVGFIEEKLEKNFDKRDIYNELKNFLMKFGVAYILIGGEKEFYFFEEIKNEFKSFLLGNAFDLNNEIYMSSCAMISDVEQKLSARKERRTSTENNVQKNFADVVIVYSKLKKMITVIEYYLDNNLDDNIDFFSVCEQYGLFDKGSIEDIELLTEEIMEIIVEYENSKC